ncbi:titin-like [Panonychus citri]|uniref:titin-like n=1 Tax=Panonychus citri TaxID=50023 RepID=UPI0023080704|nr:titin-like [Panonychus citri]
MSISSRGREKHEIHIETLEASRTREDTRLITDLPESEPLDSSAGTIIQLKRTEKQKKEKKIIRKQEIEPIESSIEFQAQEVTLKSTGKQKAITRLESTEIEVETSPKQEPWTEMVSMEDRPTSLIDDKLSQQSIELNKKLEPKPEPAAKPIESPVEFPVRDVTIKSKGRQRSLTRLESVEMEIDVVKPIPLPIELPEETQDESPTKGQKSLELQQIPKPPERPSRRDTVKVIPTEPTTPLAQDVTIKSKGREKSLIRLESTELEIETKGPEPTPVELPEEIKPVEKVRKDSTEIQLTKPIMIKKKIPGETVIFYVPEVLPRKLSIPETTKIEKTVIEIEKRKKIEQPEQVEVSSETLMITTSAEQMTDSGKPLEMDQKLILSRPRSESIAGPSIVTREAITVGETGSSEKETQLKELSKPPIKKARALKGIPKQRSLSIAGSQTLESEVPLMVDSPIIDSLAPVAVDTVPRSSVEVVEAKTIEKTSTFEPIESKTRRASVKQMVPKRRSLSIERKDLMEKELLRKVEEPLTCRASLELAPPILAFQVTMAPIMETESSIPTSPEVIERQATSSLDTRSALIISDVKPSPQEVDIFTSEPTRTELVDIQVVSLQVPESRVEFSCEIEQTQIIEKPKTSKVKVKAPIKTKHSLVVQQKESFEKETEIPETIPDKSQGAILTLESTPTSLSVTTDETFETLEKTLEIKLARPEIAGQSVESPANALTISSVEIGESEKVVQLTDIQDKQPNVTLTESQAIEVTSSIPDN